MAEEHAELMNECCPQHLGKGVQEWSDKETQERKKNMERSAHEIKKYQRRNYCNNLSLPPPVGRLLLEAVDELHKLMLLK